MITLSGLAVPVLGLALVLIIEGLVYALAPSRVEDLLEVLRNLPIETRRLIGLGALALGVALIWAVALAGGMV